jgi:DNA-binding winged helix-turn-helix (wHTH) protein/Tfp pilus assembly protein PilF
MSTHADTVQFADWAFNPKRNTLEHTPSGNTQRLEPKVAELLSVLISHERAAVSKEVLMQTLWPDSVVGDDTLARAISRLRSALSDSAKDPTFIETIPKRGCRFMVEASPMDSSHKTSPKPQKPVSALIVFGAIAILAGFWLFFASTAKDQLLDERIQRADALYMKFEQQGNEAALTLYEKVLEQDADNSRALAGVANSLVQRLVRWPNDFERPPTQTVSLTDALESGQLSTPQAALALQKAIVIAEQAVEADPNDVQAIKALGFAYSANGQLQRAIELYQSAVELDQNAWRSLLNLSELLEYTGQHEAALNTRIQAFHAMQAAFSSEPQHIEPWQPQIGLLIAAQYQENEDFLEAERWALNVLELVPFDRAATEILVTSLIGTGDEASAQETCVTYQSRLEPLDTCITFAPSSAAKR